MWKKKMLMKCALTNHINDQLTLGKETTVPLRDAIEGKDTAIPQIPAHNYLCEICKKPFTNCNSFADHLETHTGEAIGDCSICNESFDDKQEFCKHLIAHFKETRQSCKTCYKTSITWLELKCHLDWHDKAFQCHLCDETLVNKQHLDQHLLFHTVEEYYTCKICKKLGSQNLCEQIAVKPKQTYKCNTCGKGFDYKRSLSCHQRVHRKNRSFTNNLSPKDFVLKTSQSKSSHQEVSIKTDLFNRLIDSHARGENAINSVDSDNGDLIEVDMMDSNPGDSIKINLVNSNSSDSFDIDLTDFLYEDSNDTILTD
ncbi:zinc finger protein 28-like [Argiope bruennichi]|uniref:Zinc finger protein 235 like protein n=1 Tax=Argiope bruennichi TaxID=94029 RepID=A0A8T0EBT0_ARGBR|nr:zinc finger protein 28-like [Argiope bruennichi]KAF8770582.1 Zinc finger protein 235 like protein [Argiope bruennichi]